MNAHYVCQNIEKSLDKPLASGMLMLSVDGVFVARAHQANTFISRLRGLHAHLPLANDEALVLSGCNAIHTLTMRHPIDVIFLAESGEVLEQKTVPVKRWCSNKRAVCVVEMNAGVCVKLGIVPGVILDRHTGVWR